MGMGTRETGAHWEVASTCLPGKPRNQAVPYDWSVLEAAARLPRWVNIMMGPPKPGVEWHETKRARPWCCDGVAFDTLG